MVLRYFFLIQKEKKKKKKNILKCVKVPVWQVLFFAVRLIKQKNSTKPIEYIIPCMDSVLHNTYGIIVYQEQIMMLSRLIADFNKSESALLRMAIGMFKKEMLPVLRNQFIKGGIKNGYKKSALEKLWNEIESKGKYAFNKSHSVCYTWLAYQMAYLKANYPKEFVQVMEKYHS